MLSLRLSLSACEVCRRQKIKVGVVQSIDIFMLIKMKSVTVDYLSARDVSLEEEA